MRVKDVEFGQGILAIRDAKGGKDRVVPLPKRLIVPLRAQLAVAQAIHAADLKAGFGRVSLPYALSVKYPKADREWAWQYVFPLQNFRTIRGLATPSGTTCLTRIWKMPSSKLR